MRKQVTAGGTWGSIPLGTSERWWRTGPRFSHLRVRKWGYLSTNCYLSLVEAVPGHHELSPFWPALCVDPSKLLGLKEGICRRFMVPEC